MTYRISKRQGLAGLLVLCGSIAWLSGMSPAAETQTKEPPGVVDRIETTVKQAAETIERELTGVVKKLEDSETPKKIGNELKRSADALTEKAEQAGKKLKESFKSE